MFEVIAAVCLQPFVEVTSIFALNMTNLAFISSSFSFLQKNFTLFSEFGNFHIRAVCPDPRKTLNVFFSTFFPLFACRAVECDWLTDAVPDYYHAGGLKLVSESSLGV